MKNYSLQIAGVWILATFMLSCGGGAFLKNMTMAQDAYLASEFQKSRIYSQNALKLKPDDPGANKLYVLTLLNLDDTTEALRHTRSLSKIHPTLSGELLYHCGVKLYNMGDLAQASPCLHSVDPSLYSEFPAHLYLGLIAYRESNLDTAEPLLRDGIQAKPIVEGLFTYGRLLMKRGKPSEASILFKQVIETNPGITLAHFYLGNAEFLTGNYRSAIVHYGSVPEDSPLYLGARFNAAEAYERMGNLPRAIKLYQEILLINPADNDVLFNLGSALIKTASDSLVAQAIDIYTTLVEDSSDDPEVWYNLGLAELHLNRPDKAEVTLRNTLMLKPDNPDAHFNLGIALWKLGKSDEAKNQWEITLSLNPDHARASTYLKKSEGGVILF